MLTLDTGMAGIFNVENLAGVIAASHCLGIEMPKLVRASRHFLGVKRRQEVCGIAYGVTVVDAERGGLACEREDRAFGPTADAARDDVQDARRIGHESRPVTSPGDG